MRPAASAWISDTSQSSQGRDPDEMTRSSFLQVRHRDIDHGSEANNIHGNRIPLMLPCVCRVLEACSGTDDEEFNITRLFDQLSHERHRKLGLSHIDRLDQARPGKLGPKLCEQIGAPRHDADAVAIE
jgi:hypothetical protein